MPNTLTTRGFHHITMVSRDAPTTLAFYGELLGLGLVKKTVNFDDPSAYHLYFGNDGGRPGTILTFFEWPHARKGQWGAGGVHHLALGVATPEALLKWKRRLTDAGVPSDGPIDRGYFKSLYFADPDGQILEIATAGPGYAIDEPPHALGRELLIPPEERLPSGRDNAAIVSAVHPEPVPVITPDMHLQGIHHISAITDRLEQVGAFYEEALGLKLVKKTYNQDDGQTKHYFWADYDGQSVSPHSSLTLFDWSGSTLRERPGIGQTHHIAFRAESAEQQLEWREHLVALGVDVSPVMERTYFESIYFRAPDGLLLEIATDGPGFSVDEDETELGTHLKLPEWLETQRSSIAASLAPLP
ncbi:MAG: VOC family protein [Longimicrobiales bacterium]|nr:VOC family protein [Longimicrobiales bacterium]